MSPRPLIVTADLDVLEDLLRLAALAGTEVDVAHDPAAARRLWSSAPLVVVHGPAPGLPRRSGVVQVTGDLDDTSVWQCAVSSGAEHVCLLPEADGQDWLVRRLSGAGVDGLLVGVVGGRGGAGASVLAASLAHVAARTGRRPCLVDADPLGGGLDLLVGGEGVPGLRWQDLAAARAPLAPSALRGALPEVDRVPVLAWDRGSPVAEVAPLAVEAVLLAARGGHDVVVVDLPRSVPAELVAVLDVVLLVVPAEVRATAAASRLLAGSLAGAGDLRLVVRTPGPGRLAAGDVARSLGVALAGTYASDSRVPGRAERGVPPGRRVRSSLALLCADLLEDLLPTVAAA